jgi:hypothetical protein
MDEEFWNSEAKSFTFFEEWDEEVTYTESYSCGTSKNPRTCTRTKTRIDHHPEYWELRTRLNETIRISKSQYRQAANRFGAKEVDIYRSGQVSWGDGDKFVSYPNITIPTSQPHSYENYVRAAKSNVIHTKVPQANIDLLVKSKKLREYPSIYRSDYGSIRLNRIIDTTGLVKNKKEYLDELNMLSVRIGRMKKANPIIYFTNEDRDFKDALEQYWSKGKKNDITLILGLDSNGKVAWSDVITYTNSTDFIVDMQNKFKDMNATDSKGILGVFNKYIMSSYIRKPMKEFAYLKDNISLEWYWQLIVFLGNVLLSGFIMYKMLNNYESKGSYRSGYRGYGGRRF